MNLFAYNAPPPPLSALEELAEAEATMAELYALADLGVIDPEELGFLPFLLAPLAAAGAAASAAAAVVAKVAAIVGAAVAAGKGIADAIASAIPKDKQSDAGFKLQAFAKALGDGHFDGKLKQDARAVFEEVRTQVLPELNLPPAPDDGKIPEAGLMGGNLIYGAIGQRMRQIGAVLKPRIAPAPPPAPRPVARPAPPPVQRTPPAPTAPRFVAQALSPEPRTQLVAAQPAAARSSSMPLVVGGAAVVAASGGLVWWLTRRKEGRRAPHQ